MTLMGHVHRTGGHKIQFCVHGWWVWVWAILVCLWWACGRTALSPGWFCGAAEMNFVPHRHWRGQSLWAHGGPWWAHGGPWWAHGGPRVACANLTQLLCILIHIYRESEREGEGERERDIYIYVYVYVCIYVYIFLSCTNLSLLIFYTPSLQWNPL